MLIKIRAYVSARKETVKKHGADSLEIHVREPAEEGRANGRILTIVRFMHPHARVRIKKGHHSSHKIISIGE